jgi:hypothetical protein
MLFSCRHLWLQSHLLSAFSDRLHRQKKDGERGNDSGSTAIRFVSISARFGIYTVVCLNGTLAKARICSWDT